MKWVGRSPRSRRKPIIVLLLVPVFFLQVLAGSLLAASPDPPTTFGLPAPGSTGEAWIKRQNNPFYGGKNWNTPPEWIKQKGTFGVPNPKSGGTGGGFSSGVAQAPGYKPQGSVPQGTGVRPPTNPYDEWAAAGNKPHVPAGKGVRPPESVSGVTEGTSAGSQWYKNQKNPFIGGGGKIMGKDLGSGQTIYPIGRRMTPFGPGQKLTGEGKAIYDGLIKEGFPHRMPPGGSVPKPAPQGGPILSTPAKGPVFPEGGVPGAPTAGEGPAMGPKSGLSSVGKAITGIMVVISVINIATSDHPKDQAIEEGKGWFTGIIGSALGGLIVGGPIGAIIGGIAGVAVTNQGFADTIYGNDQGYQNQQAIENQAGPKLIEGQKRVAIENINKNLPNFGPLDLNPPGSQTAGAPVDLPQPAPSPNPETPTANPNPLPANPGNLGMNPPLTGIAGGPADLPQTPPSPKPETPSANSNPPQPNPGNLGMNPPLPGIAGGPADLGPAKTMSGSDPTKAGQTTGMEGTQDFNTTQSYHDSRRSHSKTKSQKDLQIAGSTQSERGTAADSDSQQKKGKIDSQGLETGQTISSTQQEGKKAQETSQIINQTSIGTILAGGLMGGLSSGVAIGLDAGFGTLGRGAGIQVSSNLGVLPNQPSNPGSGSSGSNPGNGNAPGGANPTGGTSIAYSGSMKGSATVTAGYGNGGKVSCSFTAQFQVTLNPNGSASGSQSGGFYATFDDSGNGMSCTQYGAQTNYSGSHSNGKVTLSSANRSYAGQYSATTLTASGGGSGPMTLSNGKPANANVSGSMTLTR
jgi:hypothetical protein